MAQQAERPGIVALLADHQGKQPVQQVVIPFLLAEQAEFIAHPLAISGQQGVLILIQRRV